VTAEQGSGIEEQGAHDLGYPGMPPLNVEKYRKYVDHFDLTEERKVELLQTLWSIMYAFVQVGFGVDSIQRCLPALAEFSSEVESDELEGAAAADDFNGVAADGKDE
jgi:hypothetical protein